MSENSESMIERVAKALAMCMETGFDPDTPVYNMENELVPYWTCLVKEARAAIEAMREPTREMLNSGDEMMPQFSEEDKHLTGFDVSGEVWQAMIDTALAPAHPDD